MESVEDWTGRIAAEVAWLAFLDKVVAESDDPEKVEKMKEGAERSRATLADYRKSLAKAQAKEDRTAANVAIPDLPLKTKVRVTGEDPDWNAGCAGYPINGSVGRIVHEIQLPDGRQAVQFKGVHNKGVLEVVGETRSAYFVGRDEDGECCALTMFIPKSCFEAY